MSFNTNNTPSVTEALETRITCRDFLNKPVSGEILKRILHTSLRSASGGNLQPWKIHIIQGETLKKFKKTCVDRMMAGKVEKPTYPAYPSPLWEPQRSWRYKLGEDMYALMGIEKDNKMGRLAWLAQNGKFFGAPVGIIITGDKRLDQPQYMDIGIYLQSLMLLAREEGLHTAPQGWWRNWTSVSHDFLDIPEEEEVLVGMALGYGNPEHPVNALYADRANLDDIAKFYD